MIEALAVDAVRRRELLAAITFVVERTPPLDVVGAHEYLDRLLGAT